VRAIPRAYFTYEQSGQRSQKSFEKLQKLRKLRPFSVLLETKGLYGGLHTLLSRSYYYLRRRSPAPPFPPDHRQAGERGANMEHLLVPDVGLLLQTCFTDYALTHPGHGVYNSESHPKVICRSMGHASNPCTRAPRQNGLCSTAGQHGRAAWLLCTAA
jgi:hypothetical protein